MPYNRWHDNFLLTVEWIRAMSNYLNDCAGNGMDGESIKAYLRENIPDIGYAIYKPFVNNKKIVGYKIVDFDFDNSGRFAPLFEHRKTLTESVRECKSIYDYIRNFS